MILVTGVLVCILGAYLTIKGLDEDTFVYYISGFGIVFVGLTLTIGSLGVFDTTTLDVTCEVNDVVVYVETTTTVPDFGDYDKCVVLTVNE